ncbi:hypothetical protein BH09GEM1_BH09GEM1_28200 [soil metagenome]
MSKIEQLEHEVETLSAPELSEFRRWFLDFDAAAWDDQFTADAQAGKLDVLAEAALRQHRSGQSRAL